ncbi:Periplasmic protein TonB [Commensalibacter communis]|uniref:energy transducer TonB n=1 Tax=Commensalibacter communis TaxID=2972786 RepID=UPI0022FF8584|nr:energy transducer TonB [Commensalibacter communis]CAI3937636.1 Periplasmic protein TonB [Commensalibacter communis]CAI3938853.1 Periplasmic protein TonB [Commensalibacter communis]
MMKQEPISPSIDVSKMAVPPKRMIPVLTKIGAGRLVGDGFVAVLLHGLCMLIPFWCMDIPKHDNPLHSTIEVAFEAPETLPTPERVQELPDVINDEPESRSIETPSLSEALPESEAFAALPVVKSQPVIKERISSRPQSSVGPKRSEEARSVSSQVGRQITQPSENVVRPTKPPVAKNLTAAQRCSTLSKEYPMAARRRHEEGTVRVGYQLLPDGQIQHVEILESSGFSSLDRAAMNAVQAIKCQSASQQSIITTSVPVNFSLNKNN